MVKLKNAHDLELLKVSGRILAETLAVLKEAAREGVTLATLDALARAHIAKAGAAPTFLGYTPEGIEKPYPAAICASVNDCVVHGVPNGYALRSGDVVSLDLGVTYKGYITDAALTVGIGSVSEKVAMLLLRTEEALRVGIDACIVGGHLGDVGAAIARTAAKNGLSVMKGLTGHGVGFELHEDPSVYNYGKKGEGMKLVPGLVIAIEPMFSLGSPDIIHRKDDSFATADGSVSAHFEHTVALTDAGTEILTLLPR